MKKLIILLVAASLSSCATSVPSMHQMNLVSMNGNKEVYSTEGLIMASEYKEGGTVVRHHVEKDLSGACPNGVKFLEYSEALNKDVLTAVWIHWKGLAECL